MVMTDPLGSALERDGTEVIERGRLVVVPGEYIASVDGNQLQLTRREFQLLELFVRNPGRLLRREEIAAEVWGSSPKGRTIDIHVARLRKKLPKGAIETVIRLGYRFIDEAVSANKS